MYWITKFCYESVRCAIVSTKNRRFNCSTSIWWASFSCSIKIKNKKIYIVVVLNSFSLATNNYSEWYYLCTNNWIHKKKTPKTCAYTPYTLRFCIVPISMASLEYLPHSTFAALIISLVKIYARCYWYCWAMYVYCNIYNGRHAYLLRKWKMLRYHHILYHSFKIHIEPIHIKIKFEGNLR